MSAPPPPQAVPAPATDTLTRLVQALDALDDATYRMVLLHAQARRAARPVQ